ncbi:uncharacterized protein LY89DRAFT_702552 [Mollisia scopiformis]|uniref:N-acetyltransferase domain-containing protein n=1 Tax=Mollisia scopiformis TaxID=149040 RepID=A0A132B440_MOLSC|nr:uncharacterized protein LY89DRAFT_702552 [Mollisia scopiformis]KUJ07162.1 hypothetical protein LY89DRAFT_702552 [Mollisia scopiformis]
MASHLSSPSAKKYFLTPWTLTTPTHPALTFQRATPSHISHWLPLVTNPANNIHMDDVKSLLWTPSDISAWKTRTITNYNKSLTTYHQLAVLIAENGKFVGYGDLWLLENGNFNVGVVLDVSVQGRGLGRLCTAVLVQLGFEVGEKGVEAGTMKVNGGFRGVMRSLGVVEEEKLVVAEGRGILAELSYTVDREKWRDVELDVVWGEGTLGRVDEEV